MNEKKIKRVIDICLVVIIMMVLFAGLVKTIFFSKDINYYENRGANKIKKFSVSDFTTGKFQDSIELAFGDQIFLASTMKSKYNYLNNKLISTFYSNFEDTIFKDKYIYLSGIYKFGNTNNLLYYPYITDETYKLVDDRIRNINEVASKTKDVKYAVYYIEKDTDINFETNEKVNLSKYISERLIEENIDFNMFEVNNFKEFKDKFYETDHHWNHKGSYEGYTEILSMISNETPLVPINEIEISVPFSGAKANTSGNSDIYKEKFKGYIFDIPEHKTIINGKEEEYGKEREFEYNPNQEVSYGAFYGFDNGETIFDFNKPEKENLLIIGESFDNAIIKLLAAHFNKTYSIDLRNYQNENGKVFSYYEYIKEKEIDRVVLVGNIDFYKMDTFNLGE